jgi:dUTP pyrophosphatase
VIIMKLKVKRLRPEAKLPSRAHHDDAAIDLFADEEAVLRPGARHAVKTGIAMEIPFGCVGLIWDKSSVPLRDGIKTMGGVVDAGYRGEVHVIVINLSAETVTVEKGQKIAQMLIQKVELLQVEEADELEDAARGDKGFGSTGKF